MVKICYKYGENHLVIWNITQGREADIKVIKDAISITFDDIVPSKFWPDYKTYNLVWDQ